MTPEQQKIAIAEACGWTREYADVPTWNNSLNSYQGGYESVQTLLFRKERKCFIAENLPDYINCLNAMHEAEAILTEKQRLFYHVNLMKLQKADFIAGFCFLIHATATQRAEAFLRTIGKWATNTNEL